MGFRRSLRLCRRRSHSTAQPSCHTRCPSNCSSALNIPYEEVVRYRRHPQDTHRLIALLGTVSHLALVVVVISKTILFLKQEVQCD